MAWHAATGLLPKSVDSKTHSEASVREFGAKGDGVSNDSEAIQAALDSGSTYVTVSGGTYNLGSRGIRIPPTVRGFVMREDAILVYSGTNVAVSIDGDSKYDRTAAYTVAVRRTSADWDGGRDKSSVGIRFRNVQFSNLKALVATGFHIGVQLVGDGDGCVMNQLQLGMIADNQVGLEFLPIRGGWTNQNTIMGGAISISSSHRAQIPGTVYIRMGPGSDDGNTFIATNLENVRAERSLDVYGSLNLFQNLRFEENAPGSVIFHPGANFNVVLAGYFNGGNFDIVHDKGDSNMFIGLGQAVGTKPGNPRTRTPVSLNSAWQLPKDRTRR